MKTLFIFFFFSILCSCSNNRFSVTSIIDGNTIELNNGIVINLQNVGKNQENIKILDRYLKGNVFIYDQNNNEITEFSESQIKAIVYNSDGDCINNLLSSISEITKDTSPELKIEPTNGNKTSIHFSTKNGVLEIPVLINGEELYFIFDTGASLISISQIVAEDLYRKNKLTSSDFIGKSQFADANGDITEGSIINLSSVSIGGREITNVQACVTKGQNVPLLFGQSALSKFGKVSIDYNNNSISFE